MEARLTIFHLSTGNFLNGYKQLHERIKRTQHQKLVFMNTLTLVRR